MLIEGRIPIRYIFNKVKVELVYVLIVSAVVLLLTEEFKHQIPEMPLTIPTFIGTAISILLSFKLNQSYDRWWEARKVWGALVNDSRSLVIQLQTFVAESHQHIVRKLSLRQIAWCYCLGQSLRGLDPLGGIQEFLSPEEIVALKAHNNKALAMLQFHGMDVKTLREQGHMELFAQVQIDDTLVRLCDSQGKAERIKATVFPVTYRLFLHSIIYLFVITLSISLKNVAGYLEIPLLLLLSSAFFLLERSATHMQDPFENRPTDTAVTAIARTIEINIRQLLGERDIPAPLKPEGFYLK